MAESTHLRTQLHVTALALVLLTVPATAQIEVGDNDFKISSAANIANIHDATQVTVAHNPINGEYLVVWSETAAILASSGSEIIDRRVIVGRLIDAATGGKGSLKLISTSNRAGRSASEPAVAYNSVENEYLVVWSEDDGDVLALNEEEIFGQILSSSANPVGGNFRISDVGGTGNTTYAAFKPAVAHNGVENEYLVVWAGNDDVGDLNAWDIEIFGQRLDENGSPLGVNDFRISDAGGIGGKFFYEATAPAIAFNSVENEYLVVWEGTDNVGSLSPDEYEIFGQRLNENGTAQGSNDFRISNMGDTGNDAYEAHAPSVVHNSLENEYLVVWSGNDSTGTFTLGENEIFGQRLDEAGDPTGVNDFRISTLGIDGDSDYDAYSPAVTFNSVDNEYFVVWVGDDSVGGLIDNEFEIFGQRLDPSGGTIGTRDFRISDAGGTGDNPFDALRATAAFSAAEKEVLVVWEGDDDVGSLVDGDFEIFGQRVDVTAVPLEVLLEVDLSVANQLTISATDGVAGASVPSSDDVGIYLASFFTGGGSGVGVIHTTGSLTPALNTSDGTPALERSGNDPGLNVFGMVEEFDQEFVRGSLAFTGSATWTVSSEFYATLLTNGGSGTLFAPAISAPDIPLATKIGLWAVKGWQSEIFSDGFESGNTSAW